MHIGSNGLGRGANVGEGEVVGNDAAPAVGAKFDLRMGHVGWNAPLQESIESNWRGHSLRAVTQWPLYSLRDRLIVRLRGGT